MLFSIVIPTLGTRKAELFRLLGSLKEQTYNNFEIIIVSQDNHEAVSDIIKVFSDTIKIKHVILKSKGLSLARNQALAHVSGNIVTFSDDDCWYPPEAFEKAKNNLETHIESDVICFQIYDPEKEEFYKNYPAGTINKLTIRQVLQRSSIEIFIRLKQINKDDLLFNEDFGLGAKYPSGEENIMLTGLYQKGFRLSYINEIIVYHAKPSQKSRLNLNAFKSKGPLFKQIFGTWTGFIMLSALFLKKYSNLDSPIKFYLLAIKELIAYKRVN